MKSIVIYNSQTGFTKEYAQWISEAAGCECISLKKAGKIKLVDYDAIVFGSWFMAGGITKLPWFKKQMPALADCGKKLLVFAVGATPAESPLVPEALAKVFTEEERKHVKLFYCPGGLNYEKMNGFSRFMMKMYAKALASKKDVSENDRKQAEMIARSYDISNKSYIEPILAELR